MTLLLDPDIRDWVVLPLFVIIVVTGLLRQQVSLYLVGPMEPIPSAAQRVASLLSHGSKLRSGTALHALPTSTWQLRKLHVMELLRETAAHIESEATSPETDDGTATTASSDPMEAMMKNPMGMMGGNMVFMVQNMVMMQGIQHFFSGFILLRIPFPLTVGFKNMFQKGLAELPNLESSYVSSVSWYFLVMYGLRSFFKLVTGTPSQEQREQDLLATTKWGLQRPLNPAASSGAKQDAASLAKALTQEADHLELMQITKSELDSVEKRLLQRRYPKRHLATSSEAEYLLGTSTSSVKGKKATSPTKAAKKKQ